MNSYIPDITHDTSVQIMSYYDNYIKEMSKVSLFNTNGEFFCSISFIEHKLSDFPGPTWEQKQQNNNNINMVNDYNTFRPKGKAWKFRIHFANKPEVSSSHVHSSTCHVTHDRSTAYLSTSTTSARCSDLPSFSKPFETCCSAT